MRKMFVYTTFQKEGYHCYPDAAINPNLATGDRYDVSHLANNHLHYFNFKVWVEVKQEDRDIEFIQLRRYIEDLYGKDTLSLNSKSCEMIATDLYDKLLERYQSNDIRIDVSEEGINGAYIEWEH